MQILKNEEQSWYSFFIEIGILILIVLFIRFYVFQIFRVSGPSMCPTINFLNEHCERDKGEFIFVNEFLYNFIRDPKRGEIIVFKAPDAEKGKDSYIKRVIGVGGDIIEVKEGKVYLSNETVKNFELPESYLSKLNKNNTSVRGRSRFEVPEGKFLVFGDNRNSSMDSRQCFSYGCHGEKSPFIEASMIKGKASFSIFPFWESSENDSGPRFFKNEFDEIFEKN